MYIPVPHCYKHDKILNNSNRPCCIWHWQRMSCITLNKICKFTNAQSLFKTFSRLLLFDFIISLQKSYLQLWAQELLLQPPSRPHPFRLHRRAWAIYSKPSWTNRDFRPSVQNLSTRIAQTCHTRGYIFTCLLIKSRHRCYAFSQVIHTHYKGFDIVFVLIYILIPNKWLPVCQILNVLIYQKIIDFQII